MTLRIKYTQHKDTVSSAFHGRSSILFLNVLNIFIAVISTFFFSVCFPGKTFTSVFMHRNFEVIFQIL